MSTSNEKRNLPGSHTTQGLQRPEKRLTLLFVLTAVILGFVGSTIGAFTLAHISGVSTDFALSFFPSHPYLQIFGFIVEFVIGVAYSLLPRFKTGRIRTISLGYLVYATVTFADALFLVSPLLTSYDKMLEPLASLFLLVASGVFALDVISLASRQSGGFPEVNPLMMLSSISLCLISITLFLELENFVKVDEVFSQELIFLALVGFSGSMIYAVEIRSVSFRQCDYRKSLARLSWVLQAIAIGAIFLAIMLGVPELSVVGGLLFLAAALNVIFTIKILEFAHPLMYRPAMTRMHFAIVRYNEVCILSGSLWLLIGCVLGIVSLVRAGDTFFVRDSFIHSIAIGFIGSTITCFAPMLLPSLLGRRAPVTGLSFWPILLVNAGMILRVGGNLQTLYLPAPPVWESLSGPLILAAMVSLLVVLSRIGKHQPLKPTAKVPLAEASQVEAVRDVRDATLTFVGQKTGREITISVWHAENNGTIYLLPLNGTSSKWYNNVLANPDIRLVIEGHTFSGSAKTIVRKNEVRKVVKLFKDKYGDRVYRNFYGDRVDCAVALIPDN